jgi:hypothetical protein
MELGQSYYEIQYESLAIVLAKYSPRTESEDAVRNAWLNLFHVNKWSRDKWDTITDDIVERYEWASNSIACVTEMFKDMGFSDAQANSIVRLLCDNDIPDKPRRDMIAAWETYVTLAPFTNDVVPIQNNTSIDTSRRVALVTFQSAVLECLPITKCTTELSYALASTGTKVQKMDVADSMLSVAKVDTTLAKEREFIKRDGAVGETITTKGLTKRVTKEDVLPKEEEEEKKKTRSHRSKKLAEILA